MPEDKHAKNKMSIYVADTKEFQKARDIIRDLWFRAHGVYLSKGEILLTCIQFTKDKLSTQVEHPLDKNSNSKIMSKYARVGQ